jgi:DNA invertase Pin-like site-specific DNA recombinase
MAFDVYTRVSKLGERSEDNLRSPELQEAACRDWARREGVDIGEVASDKNVSGSTAAEDRKLGRLIEKIERGDSEGIITSYIDRFARDVMASWVALKRITEARGRLVCVGDGFDSAAPGSKESMGYRMVAAEAYLDRTRANFLAAQNGAAERGVYLAAKPPFGYRRRDEVEPEYDGRGRLIRDARLVVHEEEAALVRELFRRRAAGANFGELLRFFEERGVRMSKTGIRGLLANRAYLGEMQVQTGRKGATRTVRGTWAPLVTESEWQAAQRKAAFAPRDGSLARQARAHGLVYCATCGKKLRVGAYGKPGARKPTYVCTERDCAAHPAIAARKLDTWLDGLISDAICDPEHWARPYVAAVFEGSDAYERALADVEAAQQDLAAYRDNVEVQRLLGIEGFAAGLATRSEALKLARAKLAQCRPASTLKVSPKLAREWAGMTLEERRAEVGAWAEREALARFIRRVAVRPAESRRLPRRPKLAKEEWANPENTQAQAWLAANRAAVEDRIVEVLFVGQPVPETAEKPLPARSGAPPHRR